MERNGEAGHVHALLSSPPDLDLSRFVTNVKTTRGHHGNPQH